MDNIKRSRSNAKGDIWDTEIKRVDAIKYILTVSKLKMKINSIDETSEFEIDKYFKVNRRNATHNIFSFLKEF